LATLIGQAFIGGEAVLLLGVDRSQAPVRSALRRFGLLIRGLEEGASGTVAGRDTRADEEGR